jgi:hypothetical protein
VYVTQGPKIIKIAPDGSSVSTFKDLSSVEGACGDSHTGITFDRVGTFGFHLIGVCNNVKVWLLDAAGNIVAVDDSPATPHQISTPIFNLSTHTGASGPFEGPDVAPTSGFSPFGGRLLVAAENAFAGEGPLARSSL